MRLNSCVARRAAVVLFVCSVLPAGAQIVVPVSVLERADPPFPDAARAAGVDGEVRFHAVVDANGRVQSVEIISVPQPGLGFEEAVTAAVQRWRFSPARLRGNPMPSDYNGTLRFSLSLPGQAIFAASSKDTWAAVRAMVRELKMPLDKTDDANQLLTSGRMRYLSLPLPDLASLAIPPGFVPDRLVWHVYVTPGMEPARVAVGSVMELESMVPRSTRRIHLYANDALAKWFMDELARRMRVRMETLSVSAEGRAKQASALMPPGLSDPCATSAAPLTDPQPGSQLPASAVPRPLNEVPPEYPRDQLDSARIATVTFRGEVTEHGTVVNPTMTEPANAPASFVQAAQLAFGLWRFGPPSQAGCRGRVMVIFRSDFRFR